MHYQYYKQISVSHLQEDMQHLIENKNFDTDFTYVR